MKRMKHIGYIGLVLVGLLAGSCKTTKKVTREGSAGTANRTEFFNRLERDAFHFKTLSARLKVDLDLPGKSVGSRVDLKMVNGEAFQLSVQPFLGIEVYRILVRTDSILVLDRLNKRYVAESLRALEGQTPVDFNFYNLQALFTNRIFMPGAEKVLPNMYKRFTLTGADGGVGVGIRDAQGVSYRFDVDRENRLIRTEGTDRSDKYAVRWDYSDFRAAGDQLFPMRMRVRVLRGGTDQGGMELGFSRLETDKPIDLDFSVPARYTRIPFAEIVKSLTGKKK